MIPFKVAAQYARGPEQQVAEFSDLTEAKAYIQSKLEDDALLRVNVTYLLYDMGELIQTFPPGSYTSKSAESDSGSAGGQRQASSFRPSPLQTAPRPTGVPPSSFKDAPEDDTDQK